ncbi:MULTISPECIES: helix-turn-helix domain-containing protein [unclassified Paenarthrobacter]|uniref:helix-turn-helix domain-containing protein n=1 Tax=unclassified Paenarthrobacter TaxID=2634190 RepID=UPI001F162948|nr:MULTISPECIES: helix-turn-helix domain-containing protein [unclassified Paenarthrobacter]MCF3137702.1 helix-turn-helix domain-containing protein [Paenarthrobacter sp. AR 02]MCR1163472.1 helix-turn-helix domain-containing protein [Paenarthrobacter sp. UW852]
MQKVDGITVAEVGDRLGITRASVHDLIDSGRLTASGRAGRVLLIDRSSVERLTHAGTRRGRAWAAKTAWAALAMLSGQNPTWISASEKSRLKSRLRELDADAVRVLARKKDKTHRYRATPDGLAALNDYLIPSGASATREESIAETFGMAGGSGTAEGYVMIGDVAALADAFGLVEDPDGNAIIREVELHEPFADGRAPMAAIAVDLMDSLATRERSAGQRVINELLHV